MEWELLFLCNLLGVGLLVAIAFFHIVGIPEEKNSKYLKFGAEEQNEE